MKKLLATLVVLLFLVGGLAMTGCGVERNEELVGTWSWILDAEYTYEFNADGTGRRGFIVHDDITNFTWSTSENVLIFTFERTADNYASRWSFEVHGDLLIMDSEQTDENFTYIRVHQ